MGLWYLRFGPGSLESKTKQEQNQLSGLSVPQGKQILPGTYGQHLTSTDSQREQLLITVEQK